MSRNACSYFHIPRKKLLCTTVKIEKIGDLSANLASNHGQSSWHGYCFRAFLTRFPISYGLTVLIWWVGGSKCLETHVGFFIALEKVNVCHGKDRVVCHYYVLLRVVNVEIHGRASKKLLLSRPCNWIKLLSLWFSCTRGSSNELCKVWTLSPGGKKTYPSIPSKKTLLSVTHNWIKLLSLWFSCTKGSNKELCKVWTLSPGGKKTYPSIPSKKRCCRGLAIEKNCCHCVFRVLRSPMKKCVKFEPCRDEVNKSISGGTLTPHLRGVQLKSLRQQCHSVSFSKKAVD